MKSAREILDAPIRKAARGELLLELLSEEIPARMQRRAIEEFAGLVRDKLAVAEIPAQTLRGYVTPRRLTLIADGIPGQQPDRSEERRGPRVGAPHSGEPGTHIPEACVYVGVDGPRRHRMCQAVMV